MKILKKAKLPKVTCKLCGCVFRPEKKDLRGDLIRIDGDWEEAKLHTVTSCPVCGLTAYPFWQDKPERKENTDDSGTTV